jgi:DNA topoisomerase IB
LGNTRAVCRSSYVHPAVLEAFVRSEKVLPKAGPKHPATGAEMPGDLRTERAVIAFLRRKSREWRDA